MDREELLRLVETLRRDKDINKEIVFEGIEAALMSAARKHFAHREGITIKIDRTTGELVAREGDRLVDPAELGRISAQTAKQVMIQKIREAERNAVYDEFVKRKGTIVTGTVQSFEGPNIVVNLGKVEAILPKSEQILDESYHLGDRVRAMLLDVKKVSQRVKVVLSRSHPDFVRKLFELEVPEISEKIIEIKAIAREAGYRTKIAVQSQDPRVDCVGACVGVRGSRIKNIVDELVGEKIDIIRWEEAPEAFIPNTLKPAEIVGIMLSPETHQATVVVPNDQLALAIGKRGQNVRLASKLTSWDIDILTEEELSKKEITTEEGISPAQTPSEDDREELATSAPENTG
ncbi:MAG: transcription termination factor NusA [Planctomycetes bacterium RIFCSPHIGHO2_02_FULL_50_42]|nr:MAG: transcription termination factor NusA [Planctomycetes bacterium GWA2_50_13]OHB89323.1 MAG: transcription termination factor NusA [Planctomycetes bacterium RIFCSPHIGHO2_02_FULL_50_42]